MPKQTGEVSKMLRNGANSVTTRNTETKMQVDQQEYCRAEELCTRLCANEKQADALEMNLGNRCAVFARV